MHLEYALSFSLSVGTSFLSVNFSGTVLCYSCVY